ncbi:nucleotide sugar dehydrogenase (plasmid) [Falsihalocynthiibacter sp. SS001]|uniref:nucleotide sugar dehydrogenase n=1 Tax=Falsihalocynthiibacter sp. SS001 TaxID=3349698 RepID=UPI0036D371CE
MKIAIFGMGYVGFTAACCIASEGHEVIGVDVNDSKIADVNNGIAPFEEPGLQELMTPSTQARRLLATKSVPDALANADMAIVCVGTPSGVDGAHDMRYIADVSRQIGTALAREKPLAPVTVVYRSTMRPGTMRKLIIPIFVATLGADWAAHVTLVYNPEFLREAQAISDYFDPPKVVIGTIDGKPNEVLQALNVNINAEVFVTPFEEAELTKFVDNSWHAVKVAFANEFGRVCQKMGISARQVHKIFVADTKLNISPYYTRPGGAFGGACLPKDVRAFQYIANDIGANTHLVDSLLRSNEAHKNHQFDHITRHAEAGSKILMAGLAFKAGTDDLRESPNIDLVRKLLEAGYDVRVFDPCLSPDKLRGHNLGYLYSTLPQIDALLIDAPAAEAGDWDLVVVSNATGQALNLSKFKTLETHCIA